MFKQIFITIGILAVVQIFYFFIIRPQKRMKNYARMFRQKGFTVLQLPFNVFKNSMVSALKKGMEYGDAQKIQKQVYGKYDVIISNVLWNSRIEFNHPTLIKSFYEVDKHYEYPKLEKVIANLTRFAGRGLPFSEGEQWKRKRTIFNKIFNFDFVKAQTYKIAEICDQSIKELQKNRQGNQVTFNLLDLTVQMFSSVILEIFLGGSKHEIIDGQQAGHFVNQLSNDLYTQSFVPINLILGPKFLELGITESQRELKKRVSIYKGWGHEFIRKRTKQINTELDSGNENKQNLDIIKSLIIDQRRNKQQNIQQETISSEQQLFEEFSSFFFAGTDTTSIFAQMMVYHIARNVEVQKKVRCEIEKYMKEDDYSNENLKNFTYIENLQKETSRYSIPAISLFPRLSKVDNYLYGVPVKKGTAIQIGVMANHFNEKYFKNPYEFRPERWQNECNNLEPYIFQGFSGGSRACIGKHLAMLQSKIAVIKILKRYSKIELPNPNFKMVCTFIYGPEDFKSTLTISQGSKL